MSPVRPSPSSPPARVLIAGGGTAALETALALRAQAGGLASIEMLTPETHFTYRPLSVGGPFGSSGAVRYPLTALGRDGGFEVTAGCVERVHPQRRTVKTGAGTLHYDVLVLATGALAAHAVDGALTFDGPAAVPYATDLLDRLPDGGRLAVVVPAGVSWSVPAYELAMLAGRWAARRSMDLEVVVVTAEPAPLAVMGDRPRRELVEALEARDIAVHPRTRAYAFAAGQLHHDGGRIAADAVVTLPVPVGPAIAGVESDADGFVRVDALGRVPGADGLYAVGDCATHPVKQGGLATQQADLAAQAIAHALGAVVPPPEPAEPVLRARVMTGDGTLWLADGDGPALPAPPETGGVPIPWWPPHKIAGRFLGAFLASHQHLQEPSGATRRATAPAV